jgi:putative ABC transport system permease protein
MIVREFRAAWKRLAFFFLCIALGVTAIITLRSGSQNVRAAADQNIRMILGADVRITSPKPLPPEGRAAIAKQLEKLPEAQKGTTDVVEIATMALTEDGTRSLGVEIKAVQSAFPFYGAVRVNEMPYSYAAYGERGVFVQPSLLEQLNIPLGGKMKIGEVLFTIRGTVAEEPGGGPGAFAQGPRVFMRLEDLEKAELVRFGSRARYITLVKIPDTQIPGFFSTVPRAFKMPGLALATYRNSLQQLEGQIELTENFFALIGLVIASLGGVGIASVARVFVQQRLQSIAVLKCLGASNRTAFSIYVSQMLLLGGVGSLFGWLAAAILIRLLAPKVQPLFPFPVTFELTGSAIVQGLAVGTLLSLLFSLVPMLRVWSVKPGRLLRGDEAATRRFAWARVLVIALCCTGMLLVFSWQAGSVRVGGYFLGGLAVTGALLYGLSWAVVKMASTLKAAPSFAVRHGVGGLRRPNNQTATVVLTVGLGAFFIVGVRMIQMNLENELDVSSFRQAVDMFIVNIQPDQAEGVREILRRETGADPTFIPTVSARIVGVDGQRIDFNAITDRLRRGRIDREFRVTYRPTLDRAESVIAGNYWPATPASGPEISLEESMRKDLGVELGQSVTFDIQGREITARVTSFRKVEWRKTNSGFMVVFRPGTLENAPQILFAPVKYGGTPVQRSMLQTQLVKRYPNVTVIQVQDVVERVRKVLEGVSLAVTFLGGFVFISGIGILVGAVVMTKYQRMYEAAILKTLGAKLPTLFSMALVEYGVLGLAAGTVGSLSAIGLSWTISTQVMKIGWRAFPGFCLGAVAVTALLVVVVGIVASFDVFLKKPLGVLRQEAG